MPSPDHQPICLDRISLSYRSEDTEVTLEMPERKYKRGREHYVLQELIITGTNQALSSLSFINFNPYLHAFSELRDGDSCRSASQGDRHLVVYF